MILSELFVPSLHSILLSSPAQTRLDIRQFSRTLASTDDVNRRDHKCRDFADKFFRVHHCCSSSIGLKTAVNCRYILKPKLNNTVNGDIHIAFTFVEPVLAAINDEVLAVAKQSRNALDQIGMFIEPL